MENYQLQTCTYLLLLPGVIILEMGYVPTVHGPFVQLEPEEQVVIAFEPFLPTLDTVSDLVDYMH